MAMFQENGYNELEKRYSEDKTYEVDGHVFKLTLKKPDSDITNTPLIDYRWTVTLEDGFEFETSMAVDSITFPRTRLEEIIEKLKQANRYHNDYLANAINDEIDKVYRKFK